MTWTGLTSLPRLVEKLSMEVRGNLRQGAQPFLEPGETVKQVFQAQEGYPWGNSLPIWLGFVLTISLGATVQSAGVVYLVLLVAIPLGGILVKLFGIKPRSVIVTDRALLLFADKKWIAKPERLIARLPRYTFLGPVETSPLQLWVWAKVELNGERLWVHKRFLRDVEASYAAIRRERPT